MLFNRIKRPVAGTVLFTFLALVLQPLSVLAQDRPQSAASRRATETGEEKFSRTLNEIHEILKEVAPHAAMPHMFPAGKPGEMDLRAIGPNMKIEVERAKPLPGVDVAKKVSQLREKAKELASLEQHVRAGFEDTARHIKDKNLPPEIMARHEEAVRAYEARAGAFRGLVAAVERAGSGAPLQTALTDLAAFMAKYPNQKAHTPTDPNNLPWGSPKPVTREPYTSPSQFRTSRLFGEPLRVAQAGSLSGISLPNTTLPATPAPADTLATEDVQITQAIRDLAASLNNNPVQIYNWVRNNVGFIPSYGSIQGSDMTLQTRRGNAFDTASLLIALFRAANIPARYVYGTVQAPAVSVMNWVGGVTVPQAAVNLMSQGGIPAVGVAQSGQVTAIRFEHVWVEAYIDYLPSRGAINRNPNTWVPLDPSYKQYTSTAGMNIATNVPFDGEGFAAQIQQGAISNETEGWMQNVNQALIQQSVAAYQARVTAYVEERNPNATLNDVLGRRRIAIEERPIFLGTLPYRLITTGAKLAALPDNLRWKFRFNLYASATERAYDEPFITHTQSTARLAGKKITLSFSPASSSDQTTIWSFLPRRHADGSAPQISELPQSLPGYLVRVVPQLGVDGELITSGPAFTMGTELVQSAHYFNPGSGQWESGEDNNTIAGEYAAIALDLQGVTQRQVAKLQARLADTRQRLDQFKANPDDVSPLQGVTKETLSGDLLYTGILSYFANVDLSDDVIARADGQVVAYRLPSYGRFYTVGQPRFYFGVPRNISFPALAMDVDFVRVQAEAKNASRDVVLTFMRRIGIAGSAAEHGVAEQFGRDPTKAIDDPSQPQALSAVKALGVAAGQGQRIYTLNAQNHAIHAATLASLALSAATKAEIANALAAGMEVRVHQAEISAFGVTGAGYTIIDPQTGSGAYKIEGGANGAIFVTWIAILAVGLALAAAFSFGLVATAVIGGVLLLANIWALIQAISQAATDDDLMQAHAFAFFAAASALSALALALAGATLAVTSVFWLSAMVIFMFRWGLT